MMGEWFAMGGYAGFIWASYSATLFGLGVLVLLSWREYRNARRQMPGGDDAP